MLIGTTLLIYLYQIFNQKNKKLEILILAGGLGTRLRSEVNHLPKVLAPINNKPFIDILIKQITNYNKVLKIHFSLCYLSDLIINHLKKNKNFEIFFLMGADNLINFHKWFKSKLISQKCNIVVFDRHGYKKNSLKSKTFKSLTNKTLTFVEFKKVNISSSQLRKI